MQQFSCNSCQYIADNPLKKMKYGIYTCAIDTYTEVLDFEPQTT